MKFLISHWNNVLVDIENELKKRGHTILWGFTAEKDKEKLSMKQFRATDAIIVWNEAEFSERPFVEKAKRLGKKAILVQHGRRGTSRIFPPFNENVISDKVCVWGMGDKKRHLEAGTLEEKIEVTGTHIFQHLRKEDHEGINIVFSPEHWDVEVVENMCVAGMLRKLEGVKITTKVLSKEHNDKWYDNPVVSDRQVDGHLELCAKVLSQADLVVGISESTFELMAEILDIPVVIADIWMPKPFAGDKRYLEYRREYSNACKRVKNILKLNETVRQQLKHPEELRDERKQIAIDDGGINISNPLEKIINVIENQSILAKQKP